MAFGGSNKGLRSDINVTPLIDVVLVLLIVFMILIPKMLNQMTVDVPPKDQNTEISPPTSSDQLVVTISDEGTVAINSEVVRMDDLPEKVKNLMQNRGKKLMFFDPTDGASYDTVAKVMDICRGSGVKTIGIMTK